MLVISRDVLGQGKHGGINGFLTWQKNKSMDCLIVPLYVFWATLDKHGIFLALLVTRNSVHFEFQL